MGWKIFLHAFRLLFRNRHAALQLSVPLILVMLLHTVLATPDGGLEDVFNLVLVIGFVLSSIWAAVGWLRFVLLEESSGAAFTAIRMVAMWRFSVRLIMVGFAASVLATFLGFFLFIPMMMPETEAFVSALIWIGFTAISWLLFRLAPFLTAAALGERMGLYPAWSVTRPYAKSLAVVAVLNSIWG